MGRPTRSGSVLLLVLVALSVGYGGCWTRRVGSCQWARRGSVRTMEERLVENWDALTAAGQRMGP